jgi:hypothetical protein
MQYSRKTMLHAVISWPNSMVHMPSCVADIASATQEFACPLWKPTYYIEVHFFTHVMFCRVVNRYRRFDGSSGSSSRRSCRLVDHEDAGTVILTNISSYKHLNVLHYHSVNLKRHMIVNTFTRDFY